MEITRTFTQKGRNTLEWISRVKDRKYLKELDNCAKMGVEALIAATPVKTGLTAASWTYEIDHNASTTTITWKNSNVIINGTPLVIMLQYGHGTGTGGYVAGRDFINPAMKSVFDDIEGRVWKVVTS